MSEINFVSSSDANVRQHIKAYYTRLLSGKEFSILDLEESYRRMSPSIHHNQSTDDIDLDALSYCLNRIPPQVLEAGTFVIGQNRQRIIAAGYEIDSWKEVSSRSRRRRSFISPDSKVITSIISSDADIDDLVNILIAVEIEFSKIRHRLQTNHDSVALAYQLLGLDDDTGKRFSSLFDTEYADPLQMIIDHPGFRLRLVEYKSDIYPELVADWWQTLLRRILIFGLEDIPVYFISSNLHSLNNIVGGYVTAHQPSIYDHLRDNHPDLYQQIKRIEADPKTIRKEDFFYYVSNLYFKEIPQAKIKKIQWEQDLGIKNISLNHDLYCNAQVVPVSSLASSQFLDPSITLSNKEKISQSKAVIINIDYPLGYAAYLILNQILGFLHQLKGVYVVGKAAILRGDIGDIQIPNVIFDERLNNVISFDNTFNTNLPTNSQNFSVLSNQKAISVQGVILENQSQIDNYQKSNFNIIEMESGSYLTAIAQKYQYNGEFPRNQVCKLSGLPFDLGIINYASDNPLSANLGQGAMAMRGVEPTYASLVAIVQRIVNLEEAT